MMISCNFLCPHMSWHPLVLGACELIGLGYALLPFFLPKARGFLVQVGTSRTWLDDAALVTKDRTPSRRVWATKETMLRC
jgi:hypothetical protein